MSTYLKVTFEISSRSAAEATDKLFSAIFYPRLIRALFGLETLAKSFAQEGLPPTYDLKPIRRAVNEVLKALPDS